jgi:hypothetical protein
MNDLLTTSQNWKKNLGLANVNKGHKLHKDNHKWCLEASKKKTCPFKIFKKKTNL